MDTAPFVLDVGLPIAKSYPAEGDFFIEGYCADFERDREGDRFLPGAFDEAVKKATQDSIPLLLEHDNRRQLGVIEELKVDDKGLWTRARVTAPPAGSHLEHDVNQIRRGMKRGLSVRGLSKVSGNKIGYIDLAEVSVTPVPMQPGALFRVAEKSLAYADDPQGSDLAWYARGQLEPIDPEVQAAAHAWVQAQIDSAKQVLADLKAAIEGRA